MTCSACGFLTSDLGEEFRELSHGARRSYHDGDLNRLLRCFRQVPEFDPAAFDLERHCREYVAYQQGDTPAEHRRARAADRNRRLQLAVAVSGVAVGTVAAIFAGLAACI